MTSTPDRNGKGGVLEGVLRRKDRVGKAVMVIYTFRFPKKNSVEISRVTTIRGHRLHWAGPETHRLSDRETRPTTYRRDVTGSWS